MFKQAIVAFCMLFSLSAMAQGIEFEWLSQIDNAIIPQDDSRTYHGVIRNHPVNTRSVSLAFRSGSGFYNVSVELKVDNKTHEVDLTNRRGNIYEFVRAIDLSPNSTQTPFEIKVIAGSSASVAALPITVYVNGYKSNVATSSTWSMQSNIKFKITDEVLTQQNGVMEYIVGNFNSEENIRSLMFAMDPDFDYKGRVRFSIEYLNTEKVGTALNYIGRSSDDGFFRAFRTYRMKYVGEKKNVIPGEWLGHIRFVVNPYDNELYVAEPLNVPFNAFVPGRCEDVKSGECVVSDITLMARTGIASGSYFDSSATYSNARVDSLHVGNGYKSYIIVTCNDKKCGAPVVNTGLKDSLRDAGEDNIPAVFLPYLNGSDGIMYGCGAGASERPNKSPSESEGSLIEEGRTFAVEIPQGGYTTTRSPGFGCRVYSDSPFTYRAITTRTK